MIIQVIGLPGSGKTTLTKCLADRINATILNADEVRADLNRDLGFTSEDRAEQARRMGALSRLLSNQGHTVIADFVCPTEETRAAFGHSDITIWMDTIQQSRFEDTNTLWETPTKFDYRFTSYDSEGQTNLIIAHSNLHDWKAPTTLLLGRYQPWHEGHQALMEKAHEKTDQVLIAVRHTQGTSEKDPFTYGQVADQIVSRVTRPFLMKVPNITNIVYGRDVGYKIEQVDLGATTHAISATQKRKEMGL